MNTACQQLTRLGAPCGFRAPFLSALALGLVALTPLAWGRGASATAADAGNARLDSMIPPASPVPVPAPSDGANAAGTLRFNFRGAPLATIVDYMSEAAGFVVYVDTPLLGTGDMWSEQPVTRDEAIQLLKTTLGKSGYSALVEGRMIMISANAATKTTSLPVRTGSNPDEIPSTADVVMQIIPLRALDATAAARDLATLLPGSSPITANTDNNSLMVTDTNLKLKHLLQLVRALDTASDTVSIQKIFTLKNADPIEMAQLLTDFYSQPAAQNTSPLAGVAQPAPFGGALAGGAPDGGALAGGSDAASTGSGRASPVVALADPRTGSVIVTAAKTQMPAISAMVAELDTGSARNQKVFVYTLKNANVQDAETVLKNLFSSTTSRATTSNTTDALTARATANASASQNATPTLSQGTQGVTAGAVN